MRYEDFCRWLFCVLAIALAASLNSRAQSIRWDAPMHLIDDFKKEKACDGLRPVLPDAGGTEVQVRGVSPEKARSDFTVRIRARGRHNYVWTVADSHGDILAAKEKVYRGKAAVRDACQAIKNHQ